MQLSRAERVLLDFVVEEMDDWNYFTNSIQLRSKLNFLLDRIGQETYADSTVQKCLKTLTDLTLLEKCNGRGVYQVNPLYFFKGTEEERQKMIRKNLEAPNIIPINKERHQILSKKKK